MKRFLVPALVAAAMVAGATPAHAAPGDLDVTFGTDGIMPLPAGHRPIHVLPLPAGGAIVIAYTGSSPSDLFVTRLDAAGGTDQTFGIDGAFRMAGASAMDAALLADGSVVMTGRDIFIKLLPDGSLDPSFGTDGVVRTTNVPGARLALSPDGGLITAQDYRVARLTPTGSLDTTFGEDGIADIRGVVRPYEGTPVLDGLKDCRYNNNNCRAYISDVEVREDGRIVVLGFLSNDDRQDWGEAAATWGLTAHGQVDETFGDGGRSVVPAPEKTNIEPSELEWAPDGSLRFAAEVVKINEVIGVGAIVALDGNGHVISSYGEDGIARAPFDRAFRSLVEIDADGSATIIMSALHTYGSWMIGRFDASGKPDESFGTGGLVGSSRPERSHAVQDAEATPDGKLLLIYQESYFYGSGAFATRYLIDPLAACTIVGTDGRDVLRGTSGDDVICGLGGNDILFGEGGADQFWGGPGDDHLQGGDREASTDFVIGEEGSDQCSADAWDRVYSCP